MGTRSHRSSRASRTAKETAKKLIHNIAVEESKPLKFHRLGSRKSSPEIEVIGDVPSKGAAVERHGIPATQHDIRTVEEAGGSSRGNPLDKAKIKGEAVFEAGESTSGNLLTSSQIKTEPGLEMRMAWQNIGGRGVGRSSIITAESPQAPARWESDASSSVWSLL